MRNHQTNDEMRNEGAIESQNKRILAYLREGHTLTQLEAYNLFECTRLPSRIHDIRKRNMMLAPGEILDDERITTPSGKHIKQYFIKKATA